jgi:hypothetical protein
VRAGIVHDQALDWLRESIRSTVAADPGLGDDIARAAVVKRLKTRLSAGGVDHRALTELVQATKPNYLANWATALASQSHEPERTARAIASHLMDNGIHMNFLHRWLTHHLNDPARTWKLTELVNEAAQLIERRSTVFEVLVLFSAVPRAQSQMPPEWIDPAHVPTWLTQHGIAVTSLRQAGGFVFRIEALDPDGAVDKASELVDSLVARAAVGARSRLVPHDEVYVVGELKPFTLQRRRRVEIRALDRASKLYSLETSTTGVGRAIDSALELVSNLDRGAMAPAVAAGWAAIEALLTGPGDGARVIAGDRLASLVACSFARAELTTLAWKKLRSAPDAVTARLRQCGSNLAMAETIKEEVIAGRSLGLADTSDSAAVERLKRLLADPAVGLRDVEGYARQAFRRLYRHRNLVMHGGRTEAVALAASLRVAAPLAGAGMDRVVHAWLVDQVSPLDLAARASVRLDLLGGANPPSVANLL